MGDTKSGTDSNVFVQRCEPIVSIAVMVLLLIYSYLLLLLVMYSKSMIYALFGENITEIEPAQQNSRSQLDYLDKISTSRALNLVALGS